MAREKKAEDKERRPGGILESTFDLPPVVGGAQITLAGNREAVVDGCRGILEYSDEVVRINTGQMTVRFTGRALEIRSLTARQAVISGFFTSLDFSG